MQTPHSVVSDSSDEGCSPLSDTGKGRGTPSQRQMYTPPLGRSGEGRDFLLCLPFLNCLQLKTSLYQNGIF